MVAGGVIFIISWRMIHIANNVLMFSYCVDMAVKCPH